MTNIRIGIIGVGNMGFAHATCIYNREITGLSLTAVCDVNEDRLAQCQSKLKNVKTFHSYEKLLTSGLIDAVLIATPHPSHSEIAMAAFERDLHVLIEKPADITVSKVKEMNAMAKRSGKVFAIMFNQRTSPLYQKARELVKNGELGELKRSTWIVTNWYRTQHYYESGKWRATWIGEGGGVLLNQAPHNLDIWQWICGMPKSVRAVCDVAKYHHIEVEDDATLFVRYENGATGVFITSTGELPGTNRFEIVGTKGKLVLENGALKHWKLKTDEREICFHAKESCVNDDSDYCEYTFEQGQTAHKGILQNYANAILYGEELLAPGYEGIYELTLSNSAYLSSWKGGKEIVLPFDEKEFDDCLDDKKRSSVLREEKNSENLPKGEYEKRWQVLW